MKYSFFNREAVIGWALFLLSIIYGFLAIGFPKGGNEPGPSFLPLVLSGGMLVCSLIIVFKHRKVEEAKEENPAFRIGRKHLFLVIYLAIYLILLPVIGFIGMSLIFLFLTFRLYDNKGIFRPIIYSVILTFSMYGLFKLFLNVPLDLM
ncbi:tripartite tricarboxylate transporter TctB family protein [Metabacillus arenae]|uniref:Tripartite tricarboxylate transporter TctB family protein n=1 Tax=Metabacillus arenae TaxID=2771434 RepID=A0A926RXL0_9BACI|nr:tripartite tricarboxylate transporter TctB family protein [Metabacillus arenae]MBD1381993.1 tripartite tricarboxylate transporter TctB family protein [Metabacillus arenae]